MAEDDTGDRDEELAEIVSWELLLANPATRSSPDFVRSLLHPDFFEIGASGRTWDATSAIAAMQQESGLEEEVRAVNMSAAWLAKDVVLVTYESHRTNQVTLRSSVWVRVDTEWKLRFHQGTATP